MRADARALDRDDDARDVARDVDDGDATRAMADADADDANEDDDATTTTTTTTPTNERRDARERAGDVARASLAIALLAVALARLRRWARGDGDARGGAPGRVSRRFAARHRKCNRCGARGSGVKVKCERCKRCWYCSQTCKKAAWALEICECC
jgi:hypothetical protein